MAVTHSTAARNGIADYIVDQLDGGTIELQIAAGTEVATLTFGTPAFGAAAAGVATANGITDDASATGNASPVTKAELITSGAATLVLCSVGTSGEDINLSSTTIAATDTVSISALTYTAPV